ncbi:MAG: hypothetical protein ABI824_10755 [Acidobacteriota bacterium]
MTRADSYQTMLGVEFSGRIFRMKNSLGRRNQRLTEVVLIPIAREQHSYETMLD